MKKSIATAQMKSTRIALLVLLALLAAAMSVELLSSPRTPQKWQAAGCVRLLLGFSGMV